MFDPATSACVPAAVRVSPQSHINMTTTSLFAASAACGAVRACLTPPARSTSVGVKWFLTWLLMLWPLGAQAANPVQVVTSFSILADIAEQVGGDQVKVSSLVGFDGDVHSFQPSAQDRKRVQQAQLFIIHGMGIDSSMDRIDTPALTLNLSYSLPLFRSDNGELDPHTWQDPKLVMLYVDQISAALQKFPGIDTKKILANARRYRAQLQALDQQLAAQFAALPAHKRRVLTTHDAMGYFGRAYGLLFIGLSGLSYEAEASAASVARVIEQIRAQKIQALFLENVVDARFIEQIASETGTRIGGVLYTDALSAPSASTYLQLMQYNARALLQVLR